MDEIGLFPLGIVLLPTEQIPLHIFEPRYRELIGECLELDREFGLVYADDDGVREVGTAAAVIEVVERMDDGRLNIVVEGRSRFRLVELTDGRSFHTGSIEPLGDQDDPSDAVTKERAMGLFGRLVELTGAEVEPPELDDVQLSFALAGRFELAHPLKQELLEETSERVRLDRLCEVLDSAAEAVEHQLELAARARQNGHSRPAP